MSVPVISNFEIGSKKGKRDDGLDEFKRVRMEKDLAELEKLISSHFVQREEDEKELNNLKTMINKRIATREEQLRIRQIKEKEREEARAAEARRQEEAAEAAAKAEEDRKKELMLAMSMNFGGYQARMEKMRKGKRAAQKEEKKKILAERRKPLNIDHLSGERLQEKVVEFYEWLQTLEASKYDLELQQVDLKLTIKGMRVRQNDLMKAKKGQKINLRK
ncbi:Oidioi.mRNA.OKI2018_I69.chr2.g5131.t1.cds [Oikopleura dioica]|uniref:Oidioi.mRNA.OKI2018_I69.chr2.g5131.t1.cds n=1 Tax=Oikopleura dioica TaxID=34765 RepID=A0ABN7T377_OIKDI|nr:Oidioi.mRNA.OKI2018_I69.chr2.g5131.t1.cds [Oikopleura dioica]